MTVMANTIPGAARTDEQTRYTPISDADRTAFARDGFLLIPSALTPGLWTRAVTAANRIYEEELAAGRLRPDRSVHLLGMIHRDPVFADLLDYAPTFRYVWSLLGWNVYSHHNHLDVHPGFQPAEHVPWNWHQDGYRQNSDVDAAQRPMLSLKVAFALSDMASPGRGATKVIMGSHVRNALAGRPASASDAYDEPDGAQEVIARAGDAFIFDRRLWHSRSLNISALTRKIVFIGYTHRWIRPLDETDYRRDAAWFADLSPLRRQLLGDGGDHANFWGVRQDGWVNADIPLRAELSRRGLLDGRAPYLR